MILPARKILPPMQNKRVRFILFVSQRQQARNMSNVPVTISALSIDLIDENGRKFRLNINVPSNGVSLSLQPVLDDGVVEDPVAEEAEAKEVVVAAAEPEVIDLLNSSESEEDLESVEDSDKSEDDQVAPLPRRLASCKATTARASCRWAAAEALDDSDEFEDAQGLSQEFF